MSRSIQLLQAIDDSSLSKEERIKSRCSLAKEFEQKGNYESARSVLGSLWAGVGVHPNLEGLPDLTSAEVLLRVGALSSALGSSSQIPEAQEKSKNLLTLAGESFFSQQYPQRAAEAQYEIAWCYFREGAYAEARLYLEESIVRLGESYEGCEEIAFTAHLRSAIIERMENRFHEALVRLNKVLPLLDSIFNDFLKGNFYNTLANVLKNLGINERRAEYTERAFIEYAAASYHFEQAEHLRNKAIVENNLGLLYLANGRFEDSVAHTERARRLAASLKDQYLTAQFDESRAQAYLAQGRNSDAEKASRSAVQTLRQGGQQSTLCEALTTYGRSLARLQKKEQAVESFQQAINASTLIGDKEGAGNAALALIEELSAVLPEPELRKYFSLAEGFLSETVHSELRERLLRCAKLILNYKNASDDSEQQHKFPVYIHEEESTRKLLKLAERVAVTDKTVLIMGETGTGKDLLAKLIHRWSRCLGRLVVINCATLSETLVESQLFGHRKGSFTDAVADNPGAVMEAIHGTLFLDEIAELSLRLQAKLLRLVENKEIIPVGAQTSERVNVRIIAATNKDLRKLVDRKQFREDLYYRLQTFVLETEPLRKRPADTKLLALRFISELNDAYGKRVEFKPDTIEALCRLPLRGNVRELRSILERTITLAKSHQVVTQADVVSFALLSENGNSDLSEPWKGFSLRDEVHRHEADLIRRALEAAGGQITGAAKLLGVSHQALLFMLDGRHKKLRKTDGVIVKPKRQKSILVTPKKAILGN